MIENNQQIPLDDNPLDHSLMLQSKLPPKESSQPKDIAKEVDRLIARLPSKYSQLEDPF